jgi:hypothetical protein
MSRKIYIYVLASFIYAEENPFSVFDLDFWNYNAGIVMNFGDSYDDFTYMENRMDLNFFKNNFSAWLQYEYSNPPELGFPIKDLRKYRVEYASGPWSIKFGDIYEVWGRGLVLAQLDDQGIDFDNSSRGYLINYQADRISVTQMSGETVNAQLGSDLRYPEFEFTHNIDATNINFDAYPFSYGLSFLQSNELHQLKPLGVMDTVDINHRLHGAYISWFGSSMDIFAEYVDKQSKKRTFQTNFSGQEIEILTPLKRGSAFYFNSNFYLGNWSLFFEYKKYSFDRLSPVDTDYIINNYGNRIDYQVMPILYREQNHSFLGRAAHQTNANDERGYQIELSGGLPNGFQIVSQYSHLSRNDTWTSESPIEWTRKKISGYLPTDNFSALPYKEFYTELNGYVFDNKLQFRTAFGTNKEVPKINRYFEGFSRSITENWQYTDSLWYGDDWFYLDSQLVSIDTMSNQIETMLYQESKSFTIPLDFTYSLNNGYSVGLGFAYQERYKENVKRGNAGGFYNYADSTWIVNDINNPDVFDNQTTSNYPNEIPFQINRMVSVSVGKASKWAITLNYDWTNVQEIVTTDPKYNPLEALVYGDIKYFTGDREKNSAPSFTKNKWVALEFSYNLSSTQRISFLYGSIQGGLVCSNGICRILQPFNDGLKLSYSAIF